MQGRVSNGCRLVGVCFVPSHVGRYKSYVGLGVSPMWVVDTIPMWVKTSLKRVAAGLMCVDASEMCEVISQIVHRHKPISTHATCAKWPYCPFIPIYI